MALMQPIICSGHTCHIRCVCLGARFSARYPSGWMHLFFLVPPLLGLPSSSPDTLSSWNPVKGADPSWNAVKDADPNWNVDLRSDPNWVAASKNLRSSGFGSEFGLPPSPDAEEQQDGGWKLRDDDDEVQWQCMDDFPAMDGVLGEGVEHASDVQRCEAGNLLLDGNTYLYNKGRKTDHEGQDKPGICKLSGCWCCVRKQRPLPRGRDLVLGTSRCDFEERFGSVSEDKWSTLRPDFIASKGCTLRAVPRIGVLGLPRCRLSRESRAWTVVCVVPLVCVRGNKVKE